MCDDAGKKAASKLVMTVMVRVFTTDSRRYKVLDNTTGHNVPVPLMERGQSQHICPKFWLFHQGIFLALAVLASGTPLCCRR